MPQPPWAKESPSNPWLATFLVVFDVLTLKKVLLWGLFIFLTGSAYVLYRNQDTIITGLVVRTKVVPLIIPAPKGALRADLIKFVNENPDVVGIQVVDVDLVLNTRTTVFYFSDDAELTKLFDKYLATKLGPTPWLTGNPDFLALTLSSAVNSIPLCIPVAETPLPRRAPGFEKFVTDLCVTPIPPPYAPFSGYLSAWLKRPFNTEEKQELINQLRTYAARLQPATLPSASPKGKGNDD